MVPGLLAGLLELHPDGMQRLGIDALEKMALIDGKPAQVSIRALAAIDDASILKMFDEMRRTVDVDHGGIAMDVQRLPRGGRDGYFEHANLVVLEEHFMIPGRRRNGIQFGPSPTVEVAGRLLGDQTGNGGHRRGCAGKEHGSSCHRLS